MTAPKPLFLPWHVTIEPTSSTVQHLLPSAVASLATIAPERIAALVAHTDALNISIVDSSEFRCEAMPSFNLIVISRRTVEIAWAFSFAYWEIYQRAYAGCSLDGQVIDLHSVAELEPTLRLLRWAHRELRDNQGLPWPEDVPRPLAPPPELSSQHVADELVLCSIAMYLHHELAHVRAPDAPRLDPMEEERFCDSSAADWILGSATLGSDVIQKRAMGVAIGMLLLVARGLSRGDPSDGVHPPNYERLVSVLDSRVPEAQEGVWGMVVAMLALHASDSGLPPLVAAFDDFRMAALGYCAHIGKHGSTTATSRSA